MSEASLAGVQACRAARDRSPLQRRSRTGCLTCRRRKVKCDETKPLCRNCLKVNQTCRWPAIYTPQPESPRPSLQTGEAPISFPSPSDEPNNARSLPAPLPDHSLSYGDARLTSRQEILQLAHAYFAHVSPIQANNFIHRASLLRVIDDGQANPLLLKAISAASFRFLPGADSLHPDGSRVASKWAQEAKIHLMEDTDRFSKIKLASTLILIEHEYASGRNASAWLLVSLAARYASAMGLDKSSLSPSSTLPWLEQETRRRLMWATYAMDSISSGGLSEYTLCPAECIEAPLPCSERNFTFNLKAMPSHLRDVILPSAHSALDPSSDGLMCRFIRLMHIRSQVLRFIRQGCHALPKPWMPDSEFESIISQLKHWHDSLPLELVYSIDNMYSLEGSGQVAALSLLHMWYDQLHSTLYRFAIPGLDVPESSRDYLNDAPAGWIDKLAHGSYVRSCSMRDKFVTLANRFPDFIPASWHLAMFAFNCTRDTLGYLDYKYPDGPTSVHREKLLKSFETMLRVLESMTKYYYSMRVKVRDIAQMLRFKGYNISRGVWDDNRSSGDMTPIAPDGEVLSQLQYLRRFNRHPRLEDADVLGYETSEDASHFDPVIDTLSRHQESEPDPFPLNLPHNDNNEAWNPLISTITHGPETTLGPSFDVDLFSTIDQIERTTDLTTGAALDELPSASLFGSLERQSPVGQFENGETDLFQPYPELVDFERYLMSQLVS